jgi:predicted  nucleic acid-binding Zn-ribbon protein
MNIDTIIIISAQMATTIALFSVIMNQSKKFDSLNDKIENLKDRMSNVEAEVKILNSKFDGLEEKYADTNKRIDEIKDQQKEQIDKIENNIKENNIENKNLISKVLDVLSTQKAAL